MDTKTFNEKVEAQINRCEQVLLVKGAEYATEDRLHNFRVAAALKNETMEQSLAGFLAKHTVSIYDMCMSGKTYTDEQWDEKITDHINYLLILRAMVNADE